MARRGRKASAPRGPRDLLQVWRGVLLVGVGGAGLAGLGVAQYARAGDTLTAGLFGLAMVALFALGVYALVRVRRLLRAA